MMSGCTNFLRDWQHMIQDELGSVRGVYDDALAETYVVGYSPYGEIWDSAGTDAQPFKFTGETYKNVVEFINHFTGEMYLAPTN